MGKEIKIQIFRPTLVPIVIDIIETNRCRRTLGSKLEKGQFIILWVPNLAKLISDSRFQYRFQNPISNVKI